MPIDEAIFASLQQRIDQEGAVREVCAADAIYCVDCRFCMSLQTILFLIFFFFIFFSLGSRCLSLWYEFDIF